MRIKLGQYNLGAAALDTVAKTLTVTGFQGYDFDTTSIATIYNTTRSAGLTLGQNIASVVTTIIPATGLQQTVYTFTTIPGTWANADVLVIEMNVPVQIASYFTQVYQASKL